MTKTILKLEAGVHDIKVQDWGWDGGPARRARFALKLDKFTLAVVGEEQKTLMLAMAEKLQYALKAPERRKRP